jgi:lactoylglutathione lyase
MKLGCTSVDAPDAAASLTFFENAFGWKRRFPHASGTDGALDTGATTPPFAAHELAAPATQPWGQMVPYLRCPDGVLVELCTPMQG